MAIPLKENEAQFGQEHSKAEGAFLPPRVQTKLGMIRGCAFLVIVIYGLIEGRPFLQPLLIAALLAFLIAPIERFLSFRLRLPAAISIILSALAVLSPFFALGYVLVLQGENFIQDFPHLMQTGRTKLESLSQHPLLQRLGIGDQLKLDEIFSRISNGLGQGIGMVVGGLAAVASAGSQAVIIFTFSILMVASRRHLHKTAEAFAAPNSYFQDAHLVDRSAELIQKFLIARVIIVGIVGALSALALKILGIRYSVFLGMLVGVLTLVPAVGFILALAVNIIAAFIQGKSLGGVALMSGVLTAINLFENYFLTPKMVSNRLNINALAGFVGLFAGGLIWGIWGILLSIPILGVLQIALSAIPTLQPWALLLAGSEKGEAIKQPARPRLRSHDSSLSA